MVLGYSGAKEPNDIPPTYDRNVVDWCSAGSLVLFSLSLSIIISNFANSSFRILFNTKILEILTLMSRYKNDSKDGVPTPAECNKHAWASYYPSDAASTAFQNIYSNVDGLLDR